AANRLNQENPRMIRYFTSFGLALSIGWMAAAQAQDAVPVNHSSHGHGKTVVVEGETCASCATSCASGKCGTCNDCLRITETKKTPHAVYACKVKEICIPHRGILSLFGCGGTDCKKIEVRQLVKKYRIDEECVTRCVTQEEAAKIHEAEMKKAA